MCLAGAGRLAALRGFLRYAGTLRVYGLPVAAGSPPVPSTWELDAGGLRLSLTLSPEPYRGFSGEGAVLAALAGDDVIDDADLVSTLLSWDPTVDVDALADAANIERARVRTALAQLGTSGGVGFDVAEAAYFHRVLPYDAGRAERDNPRLAGARALVETDAVHIDPWVDGDASDGLVATVDGTGGRYRVRRAPDGTSTCTCGWWARHRGERGPCRHALAVSLVTDGAKVPA